MSTIVEGFLILSCFDCSVTGSYLIVGNDHQAPMMHQQLQAELAKQAAMSGQAPPQSSPTETAAAKKAKNAEFYYDMAGWFILAGLVVGWTVMVTFPSSI